MLIGGKQRYQCAESVCDFRLYPDKRRSSGGGGKCCRLKRRKLNSQRRGWLLLNIVPNRWVGTITASKAGWIITPASKTYSRVRTNIANENYTAYQPKISGYVKKADGTALSGVSVSASGGPATTTNTSGYYEIVVPYCWSGAVIANLAEYNFTPHNYSNVTVDQVNQDFTGYQPKISGFVKTAQDDAIAADVNVTFSSIGSRITDGNGYFEITVPYDWSGTAEMALPGTIKKTWTYSNVIADNNQVYYIYRIFEGCMGYPSAGQGLPGLDGVVYATITWDPDGAGPGPAILVVGGTFTVAGNAAVSNIAGWDGHKWIDIGGGVGGTTISAVRALTVYNGSLVAGGDFYLAGGQAANHIAIWNNARWQPLGDGIYGSVYTLATYNGLLIAGGWFNAAGTAIANNIAQWNGFQWQSMGGGTDSGVQALTNFSGQLVVGGYFRTAGGLTTNCVARWNGSYWQSMSTGMGKGSNGWFQNPGVLAFASYGGKLIAAGEFGTASGQYAICVAQWDDIKWSQLGVYTNGTLWGTVCSLAVYNGQLVAGGHFRTADESSHDLVKWSGSNWVGLAPDPGIMLQHLRSFKTNSLPEVILRNWEAI